MSHRRPLLDVDHPFFRPLWRRLLTVFLPLAWALFELVTGSVGWAMLFGATGLYAGYAFFVAGKGPVGGPVDEPGDIAVDGAEGEDGDAAEE